MTWSKGRRPSGNRGPPAAVTAGLAPGPSSARQPTPPAPAGRRPAPQPGSWRLWAIRAEVSSRKRGDITLPLHALPSARRLRHDWARTCERHLASVARAPRGLESPGHDPEQSQHREDDVGEQGGERTAAHPPPPAGRGGCCPAPAYSERLLEVAVHVDDEVDHS
jgi:hypothetical protein